MYIDFKIGDNLEQFAIMEMTHEQYNIVKNLIFNELPANSEISKIFDISEKEINYFESLIQLNQF